LPEVFITQLVQKQEAFRKEHIKKRLKGRIRVESCLREGECFLNDVSTSGYSL
jgi:hypothetical protein